MRLPRPSIGEALFRALFSGVFYGLLFWGLLSALHAAHITTSNGSMSHHRLTEFIVWTALIYGTGFYAALRRKT